MIKYYRVALLLAFVSIWSYGQELVLPTGLRQHNLTQFNSSLYNPTFSYDWNNPRSLSVWSRWQWQTPDADPTTLVLNYTQRAGNNMAFGVGAFQHNTGVFLQRGGVLNYTYAFNFSDVTSLLVGTNIYGYQKTLADDLLTTTDTAGLSDISDFVVRFTPGIRLKVHDVNLALGVEHAYDYNFNTEARESTDPQRLFLGSLSNDFALGDNGSYLRPVVYGEVSEITEFNWGGNVLYSHPKFWVQGGYNDFYGVSGGAGATFFGKLSIGALVESGLETPVSDQDMTFEIVASYLFDKQGGGKKKKSKREEAEDLKRQEEEAKRKEEQQRREQLLAQQDSIYKAKLAANKRRLDSLANAERQKQLEQEQQIEEGEKYEEVTTAEGLQPGFYLIANVFGTEKYFRRFMQRLKNQGLEPKSFYRGLNGYNYVYLSRFNTLQEAREARDSQFFGRYYDETWIFRVRK